MSIPYCSLNVPSPVDAHCIDSAVLTNSLLIGQMLCCDSRFTTTLEHPWTNHDDNIPPLATDPSSPFLPLELFNCIPNTGEAAVGKSSLVLRFVQNDFNENTSPTIGAAFLTQSECPESCLPLAPPRRGANM
jgi:hypothetical protein